MKSIIWIPSAIGLFFDILINRGLILSKPWSTTIRGRNYTKRSSVNDLNAKERNVETSRVHNPNAKITGRTVWLKTELRCYTRPRIPEASNGTRPKYVNINTPQDIGKLHKRLHYLLYFQMPGLPKHPTLIDYHTSNWARPTSNRSIPLNSSWSVGLFAQQVPM